MRRRRTVHIGLDDRVEIHNGDHFIALPTGTVELEEGGVETKKSRAGMEVDQ